MTLTIGKFDGVHRGHQAILNTVLQSSPPSIVYTFSNNPAEVLHPWNTFSRIYSNPHKLKILKEMGISRIISEPFTHEIAQKSAEEFLSELHQCCNFKKLILGYDARLGKDREGTPDTLKSIAKKLGVTVEYLPPYQWKNQIVSSSLVKDSISKGDFAAASDWLGRPYSIYYTHDLDLFNLCLPPSGTYTVRIGDHTTTAHLTPGQLLLDTPHPTPFEATFLPLS